MTHESMYEIENANTNLLWELGKLTYRVIHQMTQDCFSPTDHDIL